MFLDLLFPQRCVWCGAFGRTLCIKCTKSIHPTLIDLCPACFSPSNHGMTHRHCHDKTFLDGALSVVKYRGVIRKIIKEAKYRLAYKTLGDFLAHVPKQWHKKFYIFSKKNPNAILCPIPLYSSKYNNRGFNQSDIIAINFEKITSFKIEQFLVRVKNTPPQAQRKSRGERRTNIQGAFEIKSKKTQKDIVVLVDDLFTSANTASEAARILKQNGTKYVYLFTLAHG